MLTDKQNMYFSSTGTIVAEVENTTLGLRYHIAQAARILVHVNDTSSGTRYYISQVQDAGP